MSTKKFDLSNWLDQSVDYVPEGNTILISSVHGAKPLIEQQFIHNLEHAVFSPVYLLGEQNQELVHTFAQEPEHKQANGECTTQVKQSTWPNNSNSLLPIQVEDYSNYLKQTKYLDSLNKNLISSNIEKLNYKQQALVMSYYYISEQRASQKNYLKYLAPQIFTPKQISFPQELIQDSNSQLSEFMMKPQVVGFSQSKESPELNITQSVNDILQFEQNANSYNLDYFRSNNELALTYLQSTYLHSIVKNYQVDTSKQVSNPLSYQIGYKAPALEFSQGNARYGIGAHLVKANKNRQKSIVFTRSAPLWGKEFESKAIKAILQGGFNKLNLEPIPSINANLSLTKIVELSGALDTDKAQTLSYTYNDAIQQDDRQQNVNLNQNYNQHNNNHNSKQNNNQHNNQDNFAQAYSSNSFIANSNNEFANA